MNYARLRLLYNVTYCQEVSARVHRDEDARRKALEDRAALERLLQRLTKRL